MNEQRAGIGTGAAWASAEEREVRRLIEEAGARPEVPPEDLAQIRAAAREEWRDLVAARTPRWRTLAPLAVAASLLVALVAGWWWLRSEGPPPPPAVATVELFAGEVRVSGAEAVAGERQPAVGATLLAGAELATAAGAEDGRARLTVRLASGSSVRLDEGTSVRLVSARALELERGAVYVDSGALGASQVRVLTALGEVTDIGTQFEVRLDPEEGSGLRVRVREGSVSVRRDSESHGAVAGEELTLARDGSVARGRVEVYGPAWDWVVASAPGLEIEGLRLDEFLEWVTRETGWRLAYADAALADSAATIELYGSIEGLTPIEALDVLVPGSGLAYRAGEGELLIERRADDRPRTGS